MRTQLVTLAVDADRSPRATTSPNTLNEEFSCGACLERFPSENASRDISRRVAREASKC